MSDRQLPLKRRGLGDLIAEELRRLDADQPYADALSAATGESDLDARPAKREHVWRDPMRAIDAARRPPPRRRPRRRRKKAAQEGAAKKTRPRRSAAKTSKAAAKKTDREGDARRRSS